MCSAQDGEPRAYVAVPGSAVVRRGPAVRTAVVVSAGSYRPYYYRPYFYGAYFSPFYYSPFYGGFYSGWFGTLNIRVQPGDAVVIIDGEQWDSPEGAAASSCSWPAPCGSAQGRFQAVHVDSPDSSG